MLDIYIIFLLFLLGLTIGLLLIVIGLRLPLKKKIILSLCQKCDNEYRFSEIIPFYSYYKRHGLCNYCQKKISFALSFLNLLSGILFAISYPIYGFSYEMIVFLILTCLIIITYVTDFKYYLILDSSIIICSVIILLLKLITFGFKTCIISIISGFLIFFFLLLIKFIGDYIFKTESLGGGDVKLSFLFGATMGLRLGIITLILGAFLALPYAIYLTLRHKDVKIPFGPFLVSSFIIVFTFMEPIRNFMIIIFS